MTTKQYEKEHKDKKLFTVLVGHESPEVEKIVKKTNNYQVVKKYFTPPKPENIDMALKKISTLNM